jgi:hypothetical protein
MRPSWSSSTNCGMRNCWSMSRSQLRERLRWRWKYWVLQYYMYQTCSVLLHYDSSKRCVCPLYKFVYSFKIVKLFWKHPILVLSPVELAFVPTEQWWSVGTRLEFGLDFLRGFFQSGLKNAGISYNRPRPPLSTYLFTDRPRIFSCPIRPHMTSAIEGSASNKTGTR